MKSPSTVPTLLAVKDDPVIDPQLFADWLRDTDPLEFLSEVTNLINTLGSIDHALFFDVSDEEHDEGLMEVYEVTHAARVAIGYGLVMLLDYIQKRGRSGVITDIAFLHGRSPGDTLH